MSRDAGCREIRHALGVYVLGAIDPADRALVDDHLVTCPDCREELASLAGLPALLRRVPTAEAERLAEADPAEGILGDVATEHLLPGVLARTARVRRSPRLSELGGGGGVGRGALGGRGGGRAWHAAAGAGAAGWACLGLDGGAGRAAAVHRGSPG